MKIILEALSGAAMALSGECLVGNHADMESADVTRGPSFSVIVLKSANDWARRNGMIPQAGLPVLRLALAELTYFYGYVKLPSETLKAT